MENNERPLKDLDLKNKILGKIRKKEIEMDSQRVCLTKECLKKNAWIIVLVLLAIIALYFLVRA
ncbi:MAG: hypothetical protein QG620_751 [Patescibacteria group bacterium]|nr:hypothetical protein [Patescibacteria group bacterium]